jgi:hypothetical protein
MAAKKAMVSGNAEITVQPLRRASAKLRIIGLQPLYQNRMPAKVQQGLLVGTRKKTKVERIEIKHNPLSEYQSSMEIVSAGPTALGVRVTAVKAAMCTAALETPGLTKSSTQRLLFMPGDYFALYGTPQLKLDVVRSADINRTPDVRSRAYLPKWGAEVEIQYIVPQLSLTSVVTLLSNAGILVGVGDFRQEKGKGAYGSFRVIGSGEHDDEWEDLVRNHGRAPQLAAIENPEFADRDTSDLMDFYEQEVGRRAA